MGKHSTIKERLKNYSALALASIGAGVANADVYYRHDVDPDTTINNGQTFDIDVNCDGTPDLRFSVSTTSNIVFTTPTFVYQTGYATNSAKFEILNTGMSVVGTGNYASKLGSGVYISGGNNWISNNGFLKKYKLHKFWTGTTFAKVQNTTSDLKGNFNAQGFLGFRIIEGSDTLYGWVQVRSVDAADEINIYDAAINDEYNTKFTAGFSHVNDNAYPSVGGAYTPVDDRTNGDLIYADTAKAVNPTDTSDTDGPADLNIEFMVEDTAHTGSFRVFVIPTGDTTLTDCDAWKFSNYKEFAQSDINDPSNYTGSGPFTYNLNMAGATDINGDPIVNGVEYDIWVYSRSRGANPEQNPDGSPSPVTRSNAPVLVKSGSTVRLWGIAEPVVALSANDIGNNEDITDLQVTFDEHSDTSKNKEYRVYVVKAADASTFNVDSANLVIPANYKVEPLVAPGATHTVNYSVGDKDVDGDSLYHCTEYVVFVMSVKDGTTADRDSMVYSNNITLYGTVGTPGPATANDRADDNSGYDLEFIFDAPADQDNIKEYHVMAVPVASLPFTVADAEAVTITSRYVTVYPNSKKIQYDGVFTDKRDVTGAVIQNGVEYSICVLAVHDETSCDRTSVLTCSDSTITLDTYYPACIDSSSIIVMDSLDNINAGDIYVEFSVPTSELDGTGDFKICVVNSYDAPYFSESWVFNGDYTSFNVSDGDTDGNGNTVFSGFLNAVQRDENDDPVGIGREYVLFILSSGDNQKSFSNCLSGSSEPFQLIDKWDPTGIDDDELMHMINIYSHTNKINVLLDDKLPARGTISVYNTIGQSIDVKLIDEKKTTIEMSDKGIYLVVVRVGNALIRKKVFVY